MYLLFSLLIKNYYVLHLFRVFYFLSTVLYYDCEVTDAIWPFSVYLTPPPKLQNSLTEKFRFQGSKSGSAKKLSIWIIYICFCQIIPRFVPSDLRFLKEDTISPFGAGEELALFTSYATSLIWHILAQFLECGGVLSSDDQPYLWKMIFHHKRRFDLLLSLVIRICMVDPARASLRVWLLTLGEHRVFHGSVGGPIGPVQFILSTRTLSTLAEDDK